jgi:hypothetical protein
MPVEDVSHQVMKRLLLPLFGALSIAAAPTAEAPDEERPVPRDSVRTVDLFMSVNKSTIDAVLTRPEKDPVPIKLRVDCKKVLKGRAVSCIFSGKSPQLGAIEEHHMIGVDTESERVRMLTWTLDGEVHDHRGLWKDEFAIEVESKGVFNQRKYEKIINFVINDKGKLIMMKSVKSFDDDGSEIVLEGKFKK